MKTTLKSLAVAGLVAAAVSVSQAQPYNATGDFDGWSNANQMTGGPTTYTFVVAPGTGTAGTEFLFKCTDGTWANTWPGKNAMSKYDAGGGATLYFQPGTIADGWYPTANRVGYADPGNLAFELAGDFNGWSSSADYQLNPIGSGVYSNSIVITNAGTHGFKFRTPGSWTDIRFGSDFGNDGDNATLTTTISPQTVAVQLDLPNGRWLAGALAPPPATNTVTFQVNMSVQAALGHFTPDVDTVQCRGSFNNWASTFVLTNDPSALNPNLYSGTIDTVTPPTGINYKFWDSNPLAGNNGYESPASTGGGDRTYTLAAGPATTVIPAVYFSDMSSSLAEATLVTFTVNMTNAVTTASVPFNPSVDIVSVNGDWIPWWAWSNFVDNPYLAYRMTNNPVGSGLYTITLTIPQYNSLALTYKFSINGVDNELPAYVNHFRYVRNLGNYTLPLDTFGTTVPEPQLGPLTVGAPSGGHIRVSWLGLPSAFLQTSTNLSLPAWVNHLETTGYGSPSGIYSTNYPMSSGALFFRVNNP